MTVVPLTALAADELPPPTPRHAVPSWGRVWRAQWRVTATLALGPALGLLAFLALISWVWIDNMRQTVARVQAGSYLVVGVPPVPGGTSAVATAQSYSNSVYGPSIGILFALGALLLPLALWRGEPAARRPYHTSMPVDEVRHTLLRVAQGWLIALAGALLALATFVMLTRISVAMTAGVPSVSIGYPKAAGDLWQWLVPLTAVTVAYLFATALRLGTYHPWRWLAGLAVAYVVLLASLDYWTDLVGPAIPALVRDYFGLRGALAGETVYVVSRTGSRFWANTRPDLTAWIGGTVLWLALGLALLLWVIARRRDDA